MRQGLLGPPYRSPRSRVLPCAAALRSAFPLGPDSLSRLTPVSSHCQPSPIGRLFLLASVSQKEGTTASATTDKTHFKPRTHQLNSGLVTFLHLSGSERSIKPRGRPTALPDRPDVLRVVSPWTPSDSACRASLRVLCVSLIAPPSHLPLDYPHAALSQALTCGPSQHQLSVLSLITLSPCK